MPTPSTPPPEPRIQIQPEPLSSPTSTSLITSLNLELDRLYPEPGDKHLSLTPSDISGGCFLIAYVASIPSGCIALRRLDLPAQLPPDTGEVKRLYVLEEKRGLGLSRRLLEALETRARELGLRHLVLQTGVRQLAAVGLYERSGWRRREAFGEYVTMEEGEYRGLGICFGKDL